jgi:RNA polymerase sigma-B factor
VLSALPTNPSDSPSVSLTPEQQLLVQQNTPLIFLVANRVKRREGREYPRQVWEDIIGQLYLRLCKCVATFDPARGFKISSYVVESLEGEIKNYWRDRGWMIRPPRKLREKKFSALVESSGDEKCEAEKQGENPQSLRTAAVPISLDALAADLGEGGDRLIERLSTDEETVENQVVNQLGGQAIVSEIFESLREDEQEILEMLMYGYTQRDVEKQFEISREYASAAIDEVKAKVREAYLDILDGRQLEPSAGCQALILAYKNRFKPVLKGYFNIRGKCSLGELSDYARAKLCVPGSPILVTRVME